MSDQTAKDWVKLTLEPLNVGEAVDFVSDPGAGGVNVFLGITRGERSSSGAELEALDYEAYPEMAAGQMLELARGARGRWPVERCVIHHRVGRVEVGEASVVIAVSTGHRAEAFEACEWLIDALKREVAIWKKEVWADGSGTWVESKKKSEVRSQKPEVGSQKLEVGSQETEEAGRK